MGTVPFEFWSVNDLATFPDRFWFCGSCTSGIVVVLWVLEMFRGSKRGISTPPVPSMRCIAGTSIIIMIQTVSEVLQKSHLHSLYSGNEINL